MRILRQFPSINRRSALFCLIIAAGLTACSPRLQDGADSLMAPDAPHVPVSAAFLDLPDPGSAPEDVASDPPATPVQGRFQTSDGLTLPLTVWQPPHGNPPDAVLLALHGFNDYAQSFVKAGPALALRGIAVYAYDQRGFGKTDQRGIWPGVNRLTGDARTALSLLRDRYPNRPIGLLGVSMGGAVAIAAQSQAAPHRISDGLIIVAPAIWGRATMPRLYQAALWLSAHTVPWLPVSGSGLGLWPTDDIDILRALSEDPLMIRDTRTDAIYGLVNLMDVAFDGMETLPEPVLMLYGLRDQIVPAGPTRAAANRLGIGTTSDTSPDIRIAEGSSIIGPRPPNRRSGRRLAVYPDGWHMLLRDRQADRVLADIAAWIRNPLAPLPSGSDLLGPAFRNGDLRSADELDMPLDPLTPWLEREARGLGHRPLDLPSPI